MISRLAPQSRANMTNLLQCAFNTSLHVRSSLCACCIIFSMSGVLFGCPD